MLHLNTFRDFSDTLYNALSDWQNIDAPCWRFIANVLGPVSWAYYDSEQRNGSVGDCSNFAEVCCEASSSGISKTVR